MGEFNGGDESINRKGRPVGSTSQKVKVWNEISEWFTNDALTLYKNNLLTMMDSKDERIKNEAMKRYESLLEFFKPKLSRTEIKADITTDSDIVELSDETIKQMKKDADDQEREA